MKRRTNEEIQELIEKLWPQSSAREEFKYEIEMNTPLEVRISISDMYEAPGLTLKHLQDLGEFFGTQNVSEDSFHHGGCETCDYGSQAGFTLTIK